MSKALSSGLVSPNKDGPALPRPARLAAKASWAEISVKAKDGNPALVKPSLAKIIKDTKEKQEQALKNSIARQQQVPRPNITTYRCLMWTVHWLWSKARKDVIFIGFLLLFVSAWSIIETYLVTWMVASLTTSQDLRASMTWVGVYGGSLLAGNVMELQIEYLIATRIPLVKNAMKVLVTTHLSRVPQEMLDSARESDFKAVLLIEIQKLQSNVVALIKGLRHLVKVVSFLGTLYSISPPLAGVATALIPVALCVSASRGARLERVADALQVQEMKFEGILGESIAAISTRKVLGAVDMDVAEVQKAGKATGARGRAVRKVNAQDARVLSLIQTVTTVMVLVLGTVLVKLTGLPISKMIGCYHTSGKLGAQVLGVIAQMRTFLATKSALAAALQLLEQPRDDKLRRTLKLGGASKSGSGSGEKPMLELIDVSFGYAIPGTTMRPIIKGASVVLAKGSKTAMVGRSGIGKSTMVKILSRLYQPTWGVVAVNGQDVNEMSAFDVSADIAVIEQAFVLFEGTVKENIVYGMPKSTSSADANRLTEHDEAQLQAAIDAACLREDVESLLANGLDTQVGARGKALSRGQQQRVAIARAWIRHAKIVIADEPVSGQDPENAMALMNSIRDMTDRRGEGATVVCVTQDFSTVQVLDDVMVVDQGRLAEHGNQAALMEQESSLFARMKRRMQGFSVNSKGQPTISAEVLKSTWAFNGVELAALRNLAAAFTSRYFRENEVRAACDAHDAREPRACAWARGEKCPRLTFVRRRRTSPPSFPLGPSASKLQR